MKIAVASDHAGYELKAAVVEFLQAEGEEPIDLGPFNSDSVDYPDFAASVAGKVSRREVEGGILVCGSGLGMSIVANRFPGVRATLVNDLYNAKMSREHTDSNLLVLGARITARGLAEEIIRVWLKTEFAGGRHSSRLEKIVQIEEEIKKQS
jgi:ribose 5-phosphate isomerase B